MAFRNSEPASSNEFFVKFPCMAILSLPWGLRRFTFFALYGVSFVKLFQHHHACAETIAHAEKAKYQIFSFLSHSIAVCKQKRCDPLQIGIAQ